MDGDLLAASKICPETASSDCPLTASSPPRVKRVRRAGRALEASLGAGRRLPDGCLWEAAAAATFHVATAKLSVIMTRPTGAEVCGSSLPQLPRLRLAH
jgi:hypothetical protein